MTNSPSQSQISSRAVTLFVTLAFAVVFPVLAGCNQQTAENHASDKQHEPMPSIAGLKPEDATLAEGRQKEIWAAEHATHVIEHRFGVRFKQLLQSQSLDGLADLFVASPTIELVDAKTSVENRVSSVRSCLLYTSPSPRDKRQSRMPSSA